MTSLTTLRILCAATLMTAGCGRNEQDANGRPIDKRAEKEVQRLDMEAVEAERPMADGGAVAAVAENTGAAIDRDADAITAVGEREAAGKR